MGRLCERPGCSESAALAYGMRTEDLVFWIDELRDSSLGQSAGVLCQRHGDSVIVPRGWTLDDHRDPDLHLFRPPPIRERGTTQRPTGPRRDTTSTRSAPSDDTEQLELGGMRLPVESEPRSAPQRSGGDPVGAHRSGESWTPKFDAADDLGGLLAARSPLLSRAFRGTDRPG